MDYDLMLKKVKFSSGYAMMDCKKVIAKAQEQSSETDSDDVIFIRAMAFMWEWQEGVGINNSVLTQVQFNQFMDQVMSRLEGKEFA